MILCVCQRYLKKMMFCLLVVLVSVVPGIDVIQLKDLKSRSVQLSDYINGLASPVAICVTTWVSAETWQHPGILWTLRVPDTSDLFLSAEVAEGSRLSLKVHTPLENQITSRLSSPAGRWTLVSLCVLEQEKAPFRLCWQPVASPFECLDSVLPSVSISLAGCLIQIHERSLSADMRLVIGTTNEVKTFDQMANQCSDWNVRVCPYAQLISSLSPQRLLPTRWTAPNSNSLAVSGWFFLNHLEHTHIASLTDGSCQVCGKCFLCGLDCTSISLYLTSDSQLQACLSLANFHHCLDQIFVSLRKWTYISLSYGDFVVELCVGNLWDAAVRCTHRDIGTVLGRVLELGTVFLALGEGCSEIIDV